MPEPVFPAVFCKARAGDIEWNFDKFLFVKYAKALACFEPGTRPNDASMVNAIEAAPK